MAELLGKVAVAALTVTLASAILSIWLERASAPQFLELTKILLSWDKLAAAVVIGGASTFYTEIKSILDKLSK